MDPQALTAPLRAGDLVHGVPPLLDLAPCTGRAGGGSSLPDTPQLAALQDDACRWQVARRQQRALDRASRELLRETISEALDGGEFPRATALLAAAVDAWPQDPAFAVLADATGAAVADAPADVQADVLAGLAALPWEPPERAAGWRQAAARARIAAELEPGSLPGTLAARAGVSLEGGEDLLAAVDREYVVPPDWARLSRAGARALSWLAQTDGARAAWPAAADLALPAPTATDLAGAQRDLRACVEADRAAGIPESIVVSEWVAGALSALDRWTRAVWPAEIAAWSAHHAGVTVGVGMELDLDGAGRVVVARPLPGTPAYEAGVHQGDLLVRIEDGGVTDLTDRRGPDALEDARAALGGPAGSPVQVDLRRGDRPLRLTLVRAAIVEETVEGWARDDSDRWSGWLDADDGIAYVRIRAFRPTTLDAFDALLEPIADRVAAVVLDLRGNPGGDIDDAVQIADRFVADGWLAQVSGRVLPETGPDRSPVTGQPLAEWNQAIPGDPFEGTPVVVLVDQGTASAAEVLAGALQERAGAAVIGAPTWGKGYAQALREDPEGRFALQVTNLVWTLPSGRRLARDLDGGGIEPSTDLGRTTPGVRFRLDQARAARTAVRHHADGSPMVPRTVVPREDLPPLDEDPAVLAALLVARARLLAVSG